ncbi:PE domain-containing protein [Pseudonocardia sp. RS11V-5]|uniref:PE domain-containing protein n=1 Tax=Pseudonocardia terrae TaxID=2905831 RepID=UPI001E51C6CA|nr:PE domain-containing protein [Pseudonocardia terrae]MCE3556131.1 PE domain-containing protein [Pseudonocardia terrae]
MTAPRWDDPGPVVPRSAQSLSYSPVLRVDPERVEGLVGRLEGVIREVAVVEANLRTLNAVRAPAADVVSINSAAQAGKMVEASRVYLASWREQLIAAAAAIKKQRDGYLAADRTA